MPLYAATIFVSAFLLFLVQPVTAKEILPWFGGSASVWITSMLFFQITLLFGYLYAHWSIRNLKPGTQAAVHSGLLFASLLLLPVTPSLAWKPTGNEDPIFRILGLLTVSVGLPYFLLSTTSPLIQAWYARTHKFAFPYKLFGLSNVASLLGLLAYPVFIEPNATLRQQSLAWSSAFTVFVALCLAATFAGRRDIVPGAREAKASPGAAGGACRPPRLREQLLWILLAACAGTISPSPPNAAASKTRKQKPPNIANSRIAGGDFITGFSRRSPIRTQACTGADSCRCRDSASCAPRVGPRVGVARGEGPLGVAVSRKFLAFPGLVAAFAARPQRF